MIRVLKLWESLSQWPRGFKRRSAGTRLMKLWVRIPSGACLFVMSVMCFKVKVSAAS